MFRNFIFMLAALAAGVLAFSLSAATQIAHVKAGQPADP